MASMKDLFGGTKFDASQVEPSTPSETIPAGEYVVHLTKSEMRDSKTGGQFLWTDFQVIGGPFNDKHLFSNFNIVNSNPKAVEIAYAELSALSRATGVITWDDSEELHWKPCIAVVKVRPAGPDKQGIQRNAQNEIAGFKPTTAEHAAAARRPVGTPSAMQGGATAAAGASAQTSGGLSKAPWKKAAATA